MFGADEDDVAADVVDDYDLLIVLRPMLVADGDAAAAAVVVVDAADGAAGFDAADGADSVREIVEGAIVIGEKDGNESESEREFEFEKDVGEKDVEHEIDCAGC